MTASGFSPVEISGSAMAQLSGSLVASWVLSAIAVVLLIVVLVSVFRLRRSVAALEQRLNDQSVSKSQEEDLVRQ